MKFIKQYKTFELNDETYLSAADKLKRNHPDRSNRLRKWVDDRQNIDIDYLDPRPMNAMGGIYYITNVLVYDYNEDGNKTIVVDLESVSDTYNLTITNYRGDNDYTGIKYDITTYGTPWGMPGYSTKKDDSTLGMLGNEFPQVFYFSDRKSARTFMDIVRKESNETLLFSVNDIYKS